VAKEKKKKEQKRNERGKKNGKMNPGRVFPRGTGFGRILGTAAIAAAATLPVRR